MASILRSECPWCVRVTCTRMTGRIGGSVVMRCLWRGYRPKDMTGRRRNCPWCWSTDHLSTEPVFHKIGYLCKHNRQYFPKGDRNG